MHLISPDCSQEEVVVQLANSLRVFQHEVDQIFKRAALGTEKRRQRMEQLGKRMETLERKIEAVEKLSDVPLLNCASNFPDLGTPGVYEPIFRRFAQFTRKDNFTLMADKPKLKKDFNSNLLNEANDRRRDFLVHFFGKGRQRKEKAMLGVDTLEKVSPSAESDDSEANSDQILARLLSGHREHKRTAAKASKSTQIDFSDSLIDLCPLMNGHGSMPFSLDKDDPFAYEPTELGELADLDLPEDLPGVDVKSISFALEAAPEESSDRLKRDKKKDGDLLAERPRQRDAQTNVPLSPPIATESASQTAQLSEQIHAPPPPPPPPPPMPLLPKMAADVPSPSLAGRSDLMAAIRATGGMKGAKLKKVEEPKAEKGEGMAKAKVGGEEAEDLMSSLAKALEMRRKGMLGKGTKATSGKATKPKKASGGGETLALLRERIPRIRAESEENDGEGAEGERSDWVD